MNLENYQSVWVCGEVLIDLIPNNLGGKTPIVGGGPANTAKALAKIGLQSYLIDGISSDEFGRLAQRELLEAGVNLEFAKRSNLETCTAEVFLDQNGSASYKFKIKDTATFDFERNWLPNPSELVPSVLHIGTLVTVIEPGASVLYEWSNEVSKFAPVVLDPNIRPSVIPDRKMYLTAIEKWFAIATVIKVSEEDMNWLYPGDDIVNRAKSWLSDVTKLVVITLGGEGLLGITSEDQIKVPGVKVEVVDTVGAGDTVGAIVVEGLIKYGLENLIGETLRQVLSKAAKAAAITCSRAGANPPSNEELI